MYNESLKARFVKGYTTSAATAKVCETVFKAFEPYEIKWNADLCTKEASDLQPIVDSLVGLRARSKWMRVIILKDYVKWCISAANVENACDGMLRIDTISLDKFKKQTVASPLHLQTFLDDICDKEEVKSTDNIYRCYYWLAYGGVAEEDILGIKCSDVDFENMVVRYKDKEIPIYREAIPAFKNCAELTQFVYNHPNYTKTVWKDRAPGDTLVRGLRSVLSINSMRVELSRRTAADDHKKKESKNKSKTVKPKAANESKKRKTDIRLSYYRTWLSGLFYQMYEQELIGIKPDFESIVTQQMEGKTYKLDSGRNKPEAKKRQLERDYMEDYQRWKLAFKI